MIFVLFKNRVQDPFGVFFGFRQKGKNDFIKLSAYRIQTDLKERKNNFVKSSLLFLK